MENFHFDEVSGDSSRPPDYPNCPKSNQKGPDLNLVILVTVKEDMVVFQGHHSTQHLEVSGAVEVPGAIYNDGPRTTPKKSPMFSSA